MCGGATTGSVVVADVAELWGWRERMRVWEMMTLKLVYVQFGSEEAADVRDFNDNPLSVPAVALC